MWSPKYLVRGTTVKHPIKLFSPCSCCFIPLGHQYPQLSILHPPNPMSSLMLVISLPHPMQECVCSEQYSNTYFHSTDLRTLAKSIPLRMKCLKMSRYTKLPVNFSPLKWSIVICGKTTSNGCQMMEVSNNYLLAKLHYLKSRRKWLLNTMSGTWKTYDELQVS